MTELSNESASSKNNGSKTASSKNDGSKPTFKKIMAIIRLNLVMIMWSTLRSQEKPKLIF